MDLPPFRRHNDNGLISYDVLSSKGTHYYSVNMLNGVAISCDCRNGQIGNHNQTCFHKRTAEREEARLQSLKSPEKPVDSTSRIHKAPLNTVAQDFSLLR